MRFPGFSFGGWMGRRGIPTHCELRMSSLLTFVEFIRARCSPFVGFNRGDFLIHAFFLDFDPFLLFFVEEISCYMHFSSIGSKSGRRLSSNFEDISLSEEFSSKSAGQGPPGIRGRMPILWIILDHKNFVEENCLLREKSSTKNERSRIFHKYGSFPRRTGVNRDRIS